MGNRHDGLLIGCVDQRPGFMAINMYLSVQYIMSYEFCKRLHKEIFMSVYVYCTFSTMETEIVH